jgi:hypothetical protein
MKKRRPRLDRGVLELDNKTAERSIRPIALGRKNYLFMGSEGGGKSAAIAYTLIETAKLTDTLGRITGAVPPTRRTVYAIFTGHYQPLVLLRACIGVRTDQEFTAALQAIKIHPLAVVELSGPFRRVGLRCAVRGDPRRRLGRRLIHGAAAYRTSRHVLSSFFSIFLSPDCLNLPPRREPACRG